MHSIFSSPREGASLTPFGKLRRSASSQQHETPILHDLRLDLGAAVPRDGRTVGGVLPAWGCGGGTTRSARLLRRGEQRGIHGRLGVVSEATAGRDDRCANL